MTELSNTRRARPDPRPDDPVKVTFIWPRAVIGRLKEKAVLDARAFNEFLIRLASHAAELPEYAGWKPPRAAEHIRRPSDLAASRNSRQVPKG
jgi:hypothetical protein